MSKKSTRFVDGLALNTQKSYQQAIKKYEEFHGTSIDDLVCEALDEQTQQVAPHMLKVIDRIEDFQEYLINEDLAHGTIVTSVSKIKSIYHKNRVVLPYITPLNPKRTRRRDYIEFKDILTKDELRCALQHMRPPSVAQAMCMIQGGLSLEECEHLSYRAFIDENYKYHQCDDDKDALEWMADENHPIIWVTKLIRVKTKKPYYAILGAEAVNSIASAKLYEFNLPKYNHSDKLLTVSKNSFSRNCRRVNKLCGFGKVAEQSKFRSHMMRKFHATYIGGSALSYEEQSIITNAEIDEMQGRGKTNVQDTYIKTNPIRQKVLYAKVMNNVSLYHHYDYTIIDGDVEVFIVDPDDETRKLKEEVKILSEKLEQKKRASEKVDALRQELGDDVFREMIGEILNAK